MGVLAPSVWLETASYQIAVGIKSHRDVEASEAAPLSYSQLAGKLSAVLSEETDFRLRSN